MKKEIQCPIMHMSDANVTGTTHSGVTPNKVVRLIQGGTVITSVVAGAHASLLNRARATGVTLS
jgi:hypothetical protein